ncbi:MAG: SPOR domain-containing protein [Hyphomicrobiales bacterium]|nr:SPOR domain-containing protein [Hyphomicrobiales bacterium]MCP5372701.1 SPOR domain-containing protein [Hyphomicrobiales bacterium]
MGSLPVDLNEIAPTAPEFEEHRRPVRRPWLTWGAVGFLVVASAGAGWYMAGTRFVAETGGGVPVVRADPSPIKTRPDDPGGTKVPDRDKLVYGRLQGHASPTRVERMLPPPEAPQPLSELETAAGHPVPADGAAAQPAPMDSAPMGPAPMDPARAAPPPPPPPPDTAAEADARPESLLPPRTTSPVVRASLERPPRTMAELVSATVDGDAPPPAAKPAAKPAARKSAPSDSAPEKSAAADPAEKAVTVAKAEPTVSAAPPPPPPPPAEAREVAKDQAKDAVQEVAKADPAPAPPAKPAPAAATQPTTQPTTQPITGTDGFRIQIAAVRSADSAAREWARLQKKHADLLGGLTSMVEKADLGKKGVYYRLRAGVLPQEAAAKDLCAALKLRKVGCIVVRKGS